MRQNVLRNWRHSLQPSSMYRAAQVLDVSWQRYRDWERGIDGHPLGVIAKASNIDHIASVTGMSIAELNDAFAAGYAERGDGRAGTR